MIHKRVVCRTRNADNLFARKLRGRILLWAVSAAFLSGTVSAQTRQVSAPASELAQQNLARVAASVGQLVTIFHRDPGLMVELKRWIAKEATNHGQLISDSDLTDEAIFDRLENDITFRSVATSLVQKYGYLKPTINPESPQGQEEQILMRERAKYIAQDEEADRARARQQREIERTRGCDPSSPDCSTSTSGTPSIEEIGPQRPGTNSTQQPDLEGPPTALPSGPTDKSAPQNDVAGLVRTSGSDSLFSDQPQTGLGTDLGQQGIAGPRQSSPASGLGFNSDILDDSAGSGVSPSPSDYRANQPASNPNSPSPSSTTGSNADLDTRMRENARARQTVSPTQRLYRKANPYENVPSLYDMYLQAAASPPELERFGMQIFENGTRDLQMIPMDMPVGPDYVIGPGDGISVDLWGSVSQKFSRVVDREGRLSLPEVGPLLVAGKSLGDVQQAVQRTLRTQFRDVSADVSLSRLRTVRVYIVGDVLRPGAYDISSLSTPLNALFAAGGPTGRGSLRILKHYRGNTLVEDVDVYDLLLHGVKGDMQRLESGDTVLVPPLGPEITIEGMVRRPAIYEQKGEKSLADVIALAGGLLPTATLGHIEVQRTVAHQKQTMISVDVPQNESGGNAEKELEKLQIQDSDKIRIFPIVPYNQDAVYLEGHVIRPGKYSFHPGMRITDLVSSYKDLLPEPSLQYGQIIRLSLPDYRPQAQSFSVADALADPTRSPELQPLDTVEFFGRYDFENPPDVSVWGDVRKPGTYRASGDIHLSDAIHLAGGLSADAAQGDAQIFRYQSDSTLKILNVKLSSALDGNASDDIVLHARDRVLVHKNAAAVEPATVYVRGEVASPGRYPLTENMHISDLIRSAGGLKPSADTKIADLTHYFWEDDKQVSGNQERIELSNAIAGDRKENLALNNGDVLTVPQIAGWNDLGASISIRGEVVHPGSYGLRPGERLSSVLTRAGGFGPAAYPYGAILMRSEVQKLEQRSYGELVQRIREQQTALRLTAGSSPDPDEKMSAGSALIQWQTALNDLLSSPPVGRVTIQVSSNLKEWANTSRDVTVRAGDVLVVPKRPSYVMVEGQVYGGTAVAYRPGKSAKWYLMQAGGPTNLANKRATFVVRANGTVIGSHGSFWVSGSGMDTPLQPGDTVVVPEKALGGPPIWKTLFQNAQILSSITTSAILAAHY